MCSERHGDGTDRRIAAADLLRRPGSPAQMDRLGDGPLRRIVVPVLVAALPVLADETAHYDGHDVLVRRCGASGRFGSDQPRSGFFLLSSAGSAPIESGVSSPE